MAKRATSHAGLKLPEVKSVIFLASAVLILTLFGAGWMYLKGSHTLQAISFQEAGKAQETFSSVLARLDHWALQLIGVTAAGGVLFALALGVGLSWWRRLLVHRLARSAQTWEQGALELAGLKPQVERLNAQIKLLEEQLEKAQQEVDQRVVERTAALSKTCAALQEQVNERKQAERAMAQQASELVRSKDVLELHVQARTQELQKLQRLYESILNSAGDGIYGLDLQGRTTFVNLAAAKMTGWNVDEMVGKKELEIFRMDLPEGASPNAAFEAGEGISTDRTFLRKDGASFRVEYVRTPIKEKDHLMGAVVIFKDVTERKRAEEALNRKAAELARSNSELEQFAYVASHDLQEPLRKIQAFGDRLKTKFETVELKDGRDYLERMQSAAARMQTLINDLLTFSRVISSSKPFVPVDLAVVTKEVLGDLEVRIEKTKARIQVESLPTLEADPMQMRQLLQNLIGNALKFQLPGSTPEIKITAKTLKNPLGGGGSEIPEEVCELTVQDNGIGFEEKYLEKIFAVFQRLHGRGEYEGTGVGLAVCRRIADRHGGTITARSEPGKGATFIVTLPIRHPKKAPAGE